MRFGFDEDQQLFQPALHDFLAGEHTADHVRKLWQSETGHSIEMWKQLAELGVTGLLIPEANEGLGRNEIDLVLLQEEMGRAAVAEPFWRATYNWCSFHGTVLRQFVRYLGRLIRRALRLAASFAYLGEAWFYDVRALLITFAQLT